MFFKLLLPAGSGATGAGRIGRTEGREAGLGAGTGVGGGGTGVGGGGLGGITVPKPGGGPPGFAGSGRLPYGVLITGGLGAGAGTGTGFGCRMGF
jgi:hypothetical protein